MDKIVSKVTVLFEDPFWIGLYERMVNGRYEVCKITFGAEPKEYQVYEFMLRNAYRFRFSPALQTETQTERHINPKRMQRLAGRQTEETGIGTKAQQALKLLQEQGKLERKVRTRQEREEEQQRQFELRQEKRKEKHKGH